MRSRLAVTAAILLASAAQARADDHSFVVATPKGPVQVESGGACGRPRCPAVVVLSGSKGFAAPAYGDIMQTLQAAGLEATLVHIVSPTDLDAIATARGAQARIAYEKRRMPDWIAALHSVIAALRARPGHGDKVGVLGISLGAEIASAAVAGQTDVGALVLVDGGLPAGAPAPTQAWPPLMLIWGGADRTFPLSVGQTLQRRAQDLGGSAALTVYEGGAHDFFLHTDLQTADRAHKDAAIFLRRHLSL